MKDILELYAQPYDPARPTVCFDEKSLQLLADSRPGLPLKPGYPRRQDYEYVRRAPATSSSLLSRKRDVVMCW